MGNESVKELKNFDFADLVTAHEQIAIASREIKEQKELFIQKLQKSPTVLKHLISNIAI